MNSVTAAYRDANKKSHSPVSSCKPTDIATAPTPYRIHSGPFTSPRLENFRCINVAAAVSITQPAKEYIKNSHNKSYPVNCIIRMSSFCFCSFGGFFRFYSVSSLLRTVNPTSILLDYIEAATFLQVNLKSLCRKFFPQRLFNHLNLIIIFLLFFSHNRML